MTDMMTESDERVDLSEFEDIEVPCDIAQLRNMSAHGLPNCPGEPARWVAWRSCPCGITHRLVCDQCKRVYQAWTARQASIACISCGAETGGFHTFTPLAKR